MFVLLSFSVSNVNSEDPDLMTHSVESDLGLNCLPMSSLQDIRHKLNNTDTVSLSSGFWISYLLGFRYLIFWVSDILSPGFRISYLLGIGYVMKQY